MRMGEYAVTGTPTEVLTTIGLGSCVGLVLLDGARAVAGMAHVVFPQHPAHKPLSQPGRYGDTAVATLLAALTNLGAVREAIEAVVVGGARMFSFARPSQLDIGAANVSVVTASLGHAGIPIRATATGGSIGRSVRVLAGVVSLREAGASDNELYASPGRSAREVTAP